MSQLNAVINVIETETSDRLDTTQAEDSIMELNSIQLALVGGGSIIVVME